MSPQAVTDEVFAELKRTGNCSARRRTQKAIVANSNSVLTVGYNVLSDLDATFCDRGPDTTSRAAINTAAKPKPSTPQQDPASPGAVGLPPHHRFRGRHIRMGDHQGCG
jgi:hypothetical protein